MSGGKLEAKTLGDIPVEVTVELGRTQMSLREVLELQEGSVIELDRLAGEPLDLKVGGQLIAQGEVVAVDDYYGLRITNVIVK
jgi:flagellar motor switch protein FliN/FliY